MHEKKITNKEVSRRNFLDRRSFIKSAAGIGMAAGMSGAGVTTWAEQPLQKRKKAVLKLSCQEWLVPGKTTLERAAKLDKWGALGLELKGDELPKRVKEVKEAIKGTNLKVSAICGGYSGVLISQQRSEREKAVKGIKDILTATGELGSTGLIIVPAFNEGFLPSSHSMSSNYPNLNNKQGRKVLVDLLAELGEYAVKCGTRVMMEPLNRKEAFFLRLLADAAAICRDVNHPGAAMMGDFYHMNIEETSDMGAFLSAGGYMHHVHLASAARNLPGQDERSFVDGFRGLKMIGYQDYCSMECGIKGNPDVEIPKSFRFLEKQWEQATVHFVE